MLYDAIDVFEKMLISEAGHVQMGGTDETCTMLERRMKLLVDNYIPKDGTYILINMDRGFSSKYILEIMYDKKSGELHGKNDEWYNYIRYLDYNSKLIEMNKPVDTKKVIHSNNMYSFFVKKDSIKEKKLTDSVADGYYNTLSAPEMKYTKPNAKKLYRQAVAELGEPDCETVEKIRGWIREWLANPAILPADLSGKNYLKLFFVYDDVKKTKELYEKENKRYVIPNIYNNNDYNVTNGSAILGMPSNNLGLNAKKPFLENKTRKTPAPYLINMDAVILQGQFFDFLWGHACKGNVNVYVDFEKETIKAVPDKAKELPDVTDGLYLRIKKGKEVEILDSDVVMDVSPNLARTFHFKQMVKGGGDENWYGAYEETSQLGALIDEVFFDRYLGYHYFTDPMDLPPMDGGLKHIMLTYRSRLFAWLYRTPRCHMEDVIQEMAVKLIKNNIAGGHLYRAGTQLNLMLSLEDYLNGNHEKEERMGKIQESFQEHIDMLKEDWEFSDNEYYYAVGQMVGYFLSLSKAAKKPLSIANQFLNAESDEQIKEKLGQMFIRYNYAIDAERGTRAKNVISHIMTYKPSCEKVMQRELIAGLTANSAFYVRGRGKEMDG